MAEIVLHDFNEIPLRSDLAFYDFTIDLDGVAYLFLIEWNERAEIWVLSIQDTAGNALMAGIPLLLGALLTEVHKRPELPPGDFFLWDTSGEHREASRTDLGSRVLLMYKPVG